MPNHFNFYIIQYYSFCKFSTFFCVQEHFLVPDHTITDINGASFAGFYYVCLQKSAATIEGYYYHRSSEWQVSIFFYKVYFKTSVKVKKVTKTMDFINSSQTLVCFHIHHKNSSLFLMHDLEKIKNLYRDRRKLEFQLVLWASSSHILLSQGHFLLVLGAVHTWCSETSACVPTQTGVAFTP